MGDTWLHSAFPPTSSQTEWLGMPLRPTRRLGHHTCRTTAVRGAHGEDCSKFRSYKVLDGTSSAAEQMRGLVWSSRSVGAAAGPASPLTPPCPRSEERRVGKE